MSSRAWVGWRLVARVVAFLGVYLLLVAVAYRAAFTAGTAAPLWWPPGGFSLGVLVRAPRRAWPALLGPLFVVLLVLGLLGIPSARHLPVAVAVAFALADVTTPLLGATLLRRFGSRPFGLDRVRDVLVFAVHGTAIPSVLGASFSFAAWALWPGIGPAFEPFSWWSLEAFGILTVAPVVLTHWGSLVPPEHRGEAVAVTALLAVATWAAYGLSMEGGRIVALATAAFPLLSWAAVRFGPRGAAGAAFALTSGCTWMTIVGEGPFGHANAQLHLRVADAEAFLSLATLSAILLAAFGAERRRLAEEVGAEVRHAQSTLALLDGLLASAPLGIAIFDRELRYVRVNEALARMNGQPAAAHLGRRTPDIYPDVGEELHRTMQRVLDDGEPIVGRQLNLADPRDPGRTRSYLCTWFPIVVPGLPPQGVGAIHLDATDRVEAEEARARALAQAEDALQVRDDFLSIASHELKTPLTPLAIRLQGLQRNVEAGRPVDVSVIAKSRSALDRLTALVNDLLDVSRIREGRLGVRREAVPLGEVIRDVAGLHGSRSDHHVLELDLPPGEVWAAGERGRVAQVLDNLVDNAFKYSPGGGRIRVSLRAEGTLAHLAVRDEGIGVPPADRQRIFERFFRATNASVRSYGGLGLGLYISRDIVEHLGGRIWVGDEPGPGATFHVTLPVVAPPAG